MFCYNKNGIKNRIYLFLIFIFFSKISFAQNFEWLRTNKFSSTMTAATLPDGGAAILLTIRNGSAGLPDTIHLDTFRFLSPQKSREAYACIVILNKNGKVTNARIAYRYFLSSNTIPGIRDICSDDSGNLYLTGYLSDNPFNTIGKDTLDVKNGAILFAKFDKDLKLIWTSQTGNSKVIPTSDDPSTIGPRTTLSLSNGRCYFTCVSLGTTKIGTATYNFNAFTNHPTSVFGELNSSNGNVIWSNYLHSPDKTNTFRISGLVKVKSKFYVSGDFGHSPSKTKVVIGADTFFSPGGFIIEIDSVGNYIGRFVVHNKNNLLINCLTTDRNYLYIGGHFIDSLMWGKTKIKPRYKTGVNNFEVYAASIDLSLQPRWFFNPYVLDTTIDGEQSNGLNRVTSDDGFLYYGGRTSTKLLIDSTVINGDGIILLKADSLGNILWANSGTGGWISDMDVSKGRVFSTGIFHGKVQFGKNIDSSGSGTFITKITNYSIDRGKVKRGPYCAGDTIKIPFDLEGDFESSNVVIAELSNEKGTFDGGHHELGRIKCNKDSTIIGILPMFEVVSSPYYRIRVRSTKPLIQSFYLWDTLQVLIYSRDKANPGKDETICMGDSIKLNTYGGTKWTWSPKYRMDDSTKRQPIVWPLKDTIYKIIIADSSGCGKPDTAFKKVFVRAYPKAKLKFSDSVVCENNPIKVPVNFEGGDSNYTWQWYFVNSDKSLIPMDKGKAKYNDTLNYYPSVTNTTSEKLAIILKDCCTNKADTAYLSISLRKPVSLTTSYRDTTLCFGNVLNYKVTATGGIPKQYRYQWKDLVTNNVLSTTDSLKILTKKALKIQLIVNDGCEALGDTALFEVKVKAELKALTNLRDTTICEGKSLNYTAQATGGNSKTYIYSWVLNGKEISTSNILNLTSNFLNLTSNLSLITKDNCSPNDTIKKTITVIPSPKADFTWDLACSRTVAKFKFTGTKPNSPITTTFHWNFNSEATSTLENPSHQFAKSGTSTLALTSNNGCTDTVNKKIEVKVQAKAEFEVKDVCENQTALFTNQSQDATSYLWKFGDGQTSQIQNPKHNYTISTTTTYNVTLVAQVAGGCADSISKALTINQNPSSDFSYTCNGSKVDLKIAKGGNSYQWKFGTTDSLKTTATTYTHTIKSSDQHTVCLTATDLSGCSSQTCKNVTVGILKLSEKSFKIFPNPNNGSFTVEMENPEMDASIEVYNLIGELVKKVERVEKVTLIDLDVDSGIYLVKVRNGKVVGMKKVSVH